MSDPRVSIVIPTYNSSALLSDTIAGIRQQTFQDFEIIVVDDGSTDNTAAVVALVGGNARFFQQENQGPAVARNYGVHMARGEFIAFCDHDDIWNDRHLETLLDVFSANPTTAMVFDNAVHCGMEDAGTETHIPLSHRHELARGQVPISRIWQCCIASMSVVMVRKSVFDRLGGLHPKIWGLDDLHFYLRLASRFSVRFVDYVGCRKRMTGRNLLPTVGLDGLVRCLEDIRAHHTDVVRAIGGFRYRLRLARKYRKLALRCANQNRQAMVAEYYWQSYRLNVLNLSILKQLWLANRLGAALLNDRRAQ